MADLHVNSTSGGTPTSPYSTWATAALTLSAANAAAGVGDTIWVHPSHSETGSASVIFAGTPTNPTKIICADPGLLTNGGASLANTAIWGAAAPNVANVNLGGSFYMHGMNLRQTGSTGSFILCVSSSNGAISTLNDCQFYYGGAGGGYTIGAVAAEYSGIVTLINCRFRYHATANAFRLVNRVEGKNLSVVSGAATPTNMFSFGSSVTDLGYLLRIDGFDFSVLANTTRLSTGPLTVGTARFVNVKCPTGWGVQGTTNPMTSEIYTGNDLEILNFGDGDTNHRYWIETKLGRALEESTIKVSGATASGNSTGTYSKRLVSLTGVTYPNAIYRGPPITKYVEANGQYRRASVQLVHDGASPFTDRDFWIEVSFRGTSGSSLGTTMTSAPGFLSSPTALGASGLAWDGDTGTGPNGSGTWNVRAVFVGSIPVLEDGWMTVTPCMSIPDKTIFINDDFVVIDEGAIP